MRASEQLGKPELTLASRALPSLTAVERAVHSVIARWPDVVPNPEMNKRDALAREMLRRVVNWDWSKISTDRVTEAAVAVFDDQRRSRVELNRVREFYLREIAASRQQSFLSAMFWVYVESFNPTGAHTSALAAALKQRQGLFGDRVDQMLYSLPDLLSPGHAPSAVARLMVETSDPYAALKDKGFLSPHSPGLLQHAHLAFVHQIASKLERADEARRLLRWLKPASGQALELGASEAVAALLAPWREKAPPETMQGFMTENIVAAYGDPRINRGGIWAAFPTDLKAMVLRWLTQEDMRLFCNVITQTQNHHHWPPRRDFWLELFRQRRIDEAWVAFGSAARDYAKHHFSASSGINLDRRFAKQSDRGGSTSLLIMRIGNKIVVDGCHSYKTHIFNGSDPKAPVLYQREYFCDGIMNRSTLSRAHNPIPSWRVWVEKNI
jgi:hypothetical protein